MENLFVGRQRVEGEAGFLRPVAVALVATLPQNGRDDFFKLRPRPRLGRHGGDLGVSKRIPGRRRFLRRAQGHRPTSHQHHGQRSRLHAHVHARFKKIGSPSDSGTVQEVSAFLASPHAQSKASHRRGNARPAARIERRQADAAQVFNLPDRRILFCVAFITQDASEQSCALPTASLRYHDGAELRLRTVHKFSAWRIGHFAAPDFLASPITASNAGFG